MQLASTFVPWFIIGIGFAGLVYLVMRQKLSGVAIAISGVALFAMTIIAQGLQNTFAHGFDQTFPNLLNTRPVRFWIDDGLSWVVKYWGGAFEAAAYPLLILLNSIERWLLSVPWWLIMLVFTGLAYTATKKRALPAVVIVGLIFLGMFELWDDAIKTMALMIAATLTAIVISIPTGIVMARSKGFRAFLNPVLDVMQTLPSFVYLIPVVMIFGPGKVPALIATIIYASPPLVRLTDLGIRLVDPEIMEASRAFGTTPRQRLFGVQIPLALPTILAGVNQTTMMALAMVVIASMIGAGGLGYQVLQGIGRLEISRGLLAGLGIVALAIIFDRITQAYGRQLQERIGLAGGRT